MQEVEKPKPRRPSEFANRGEIERTDPAESDTVTGREDHMGLAEARRVAGSEIKKPIGAKPRSQVTGTHDAGSGANETSDGLDSAHEAIRHAAEDTPSGKAREREEDIPVFDRGGAPAKV